MSEVRLEHANVTVSDLDRSAKMLFDVFGWGIRWEGAIHGTLGAVSQAAVRTVILAPDKAKRRRGSSKEDSYYDGGLG